MEVLIGFLGVGGIAQAQAYALNSLRYFYPEDPEIVFEAVCSARKESRDAFAAKFGFEKSFSIDAFNVDENINTVLILGSNKIHFKN